MIFKKKTNEELRQKYLREKSKADKRTERQDLKTAIKKEKRKGKSTINWGKNIGKVLDFVAPEPGKKRPKKKNKTYDFDIF